MTIKPLFDRVVVKEIELAQTSSPLILKTSGEDKPLVGTVLFVGDGTNDEGKQIPMQVKKNDKVVFSKYCAVSIKLDGEELFVLRQSDILGILGE